MNICHITTVHPRNDIRVFLKECRSLADAGHQVSLICADGQGDDEAGGVTIYDVGAPRSRIDRALNATRRVTTMARKLRPDFVHFHDPELIPFAARLGRAGIKVVYDVHENVPADIVTKEWIPYGLRGATARGMDVAERAGSRYFHRVVTATPAIAKRFPASKTTVVQNFPFLSELDATAPTPYSARPPYFVYAGGITYERGFNEMMAAAEVASMKEEIYLRLAGSLADPDRMQEMIYSDLYPVSYKGLLSRADMATMLSEARAGLVLFQPHQNHIDAQPNKLFEYMSAGLPIIASNFPLWREIIEVGKCGICVDPRNALSIADAMVWIIQNPDEAEEMGHRGKALVSERYNWGTQTAALMSVYQ